MNIEVKRTTVNCANVKVNDLKDLDSLYSEGAIDEMLSDYVSKIKYEYYLDFHKYKHNYDYHLALLIMGNKYYMNNDSLVFTENESPFSPVSQVHYQYYSEPQALSTLTQNNDIQCIVGHGFIPFGSAQTPSLTDYADGTDTMAFLQAL